ncbi:conserved hypothetical protein [Ricinus communis]|uniref:Uncharacterized protein n=1 Tax=Ricinus communis TaxID=3988 RepID=B9T3H7_RICCO|nr:conserved hypothetical protein [Ricinus communis]
MAKGRSIMQGEGSKLDISFQFHTPCPIYNAIGGDRYEKFKKKETVSEKYLPTTIVD